MRSYLLLHAATKQQVAECRYFLLKYLSIYNLKPPANTAVVIYTADAAAFENFENFFAGFQMQEGEELGFTKTALLHHFLLNHDGAVLYCDAGTYPLQPLESLFTDIEKGVLYLHSPHRYSETEVTKARRVATQPRDKTALAIATPQTGIAVWQTSVIGIHTRNKELIAQIQRDENASANPLALGYTYTRAFSEAGKIKGAAKSIFEYSNLTEFGQLLETFFKKNEEESIANQVKLIHHLDAAVIQQQKETYLQQPLLKKWLQLITGKRWNIKQYESRM